jgi:formylglycine-generating enzyme required for sulfatase activity
MEGSLIAPPTPEMWDLAAFGTPDPGRRNSRVWLSTTAEIHHNDIAPRPCINALARTNSRGYTDMIGNVWEWCGSGQLWRKLYPNVFRNLGYEELPSFIAPILPDFGELRGGGFLDDLGHVKPFINVSELPDGEMTSHADLGFRVAVLIELSKFPEEISDRVKNSKALYPDYRPARISDSTGPRP